MKAEGAAAKVGMILYELSYPRACQHDKRARPNNSGPGRANKYLNPLSRPSRLHIGREIAEIISAFQLPDEREHHTSAPTTRPAESRAATCQSHVNPRHRKKRINRGFRARYVSPVAVVLSRGIIAIDRNASPLLSIFTPHGGRKVGLYRHEVWLVMDEPTRFG